MEVIPAYEELLEEAPTFTQKLEEKFEPASSGFVLHLGVKPPIHNWRITTFSFQMPQKKTLIKISISISCQKIQRSIWSMPTKPILRKQWQGMRTSKSCLISLICRINLLEAEYDAFRERILIKLENMGLTDLRKHIVYEDRWTTEDIKELFVTSRCHLRHGL